TAIATGSRSMSSSISRRWSTRPRRARDRSRPSSGRVCDLRRRGVGWAAVVARRHILALLVALLWLVGCTSTPLLGSADERVMQAADVDALPARRTENRQIPCPSTGKDTK